MSFSFGSTLQYSDFAKGYNIIMFSMWGIGVDIPRLIVRYGKAYPLSINIHSISMLMIGLFTIMYVIAQIVMYTQQFGSSYSGLTGVQYGQFISSILLACLVVIQFLLGFFTRVQMFKSALSSSLFTIKTIHTILGYTIEILGKVVASLIVNSSVDDIVFKGWMFFLAGLAGMFIICQILYRSQSRTIIFSLFFKHKNRHAKYHDQIYSKLLEKKEGFQNYKHKGVRYVLVDNNMYYIDQFFMHPGGQGIFNILNGKEINYYLKGAKSISPQYSRHRHTKFVTKYLENRLVGQIGVDPLVINQKIVSDTIDWKIISTIKTNYVGTYLVTFETNAGDVSEDLRLENCGKYIMMGCSTEEILDKTERPYYFCYSLATPQTTVLQNFRKYYKYYYFGDDLKEEDEANDIRQSRVEKKGFGRLSFFIKDIKQGQFSKFLLNAPKERIFSITGPYGKGLNINEKSSGYYIFIASDMGVTAFIDFLSLMLQKTLYQLIKLKASSPSLRKINSKDTNFQILQNLKVLFVGSFSNAAEFYLNTVIKELYYLNLKHGLKTFNMMLHYANSEQEKQVKMIRDIVGKQFFVKLMEEEQPDKVFFSGPPKLESILRKAEPELKLKSQIEYL